MTGGPSSGRIAPGLAVDGPLRADASGGGGGGLTGVFMNGREIHPRESLYLRALFGMVVPGRYWLGPTLVGGLEGGPPAFDLHAAAATGGSGSNQNTLFGGLMSDGQCAGYLHPGGATVMTGNC